MWINRIKGCRARSRATARGYLFAAAFVVMGQVVSGHETDQFSVPAGREFVDLRYYFSDMFRRAIDLGVRATNAGIASSLRRGQPTPDTLRLQHPEVIAGAVYRQFPLFAYHVEQLEIELHDAALKARYPGRVVAYRPAVWIYHHWALLLDITRPVRLARCSTVMCNGTYFGTDKLVHFVHMGYVYFGEYRQAIQSGATDEAATARAVALATGAHPLFSEHTVLGGITTGVISNADLAANYAGLKFFRNLTEPVMLKGRIRPPLLVREGPYWRLSDEARAGTDFFSWFVSDHWDEALNPSEYVPGMATWVRQGVRNRCADVLDWYRDRDGTPRTRESFARQREWLSTYYGEDYGYRLRAGASATIDDCCFDGSDRQPISARTVDSTDSNGRRSSERTASNGDEVPKNAATLDRFRRGPLWWAAYDGDISSAEALLRSGADVQQSDIDGETPLHAAVRGGYADMVALLLKHGAVVRARQADGLEPLSLAVLLRRFHLVRPLLERGADPDAADNFGRRPLHDAAAAGDALTTAELIGMGANVNAKDAYGQTPLHLACRAGAEPVVLLLLDAGANIIEISALGRSPRDEARRAGQSKLLKHLERH